VPYPKVLQGNEIAGMVIYNQMLISTFIWVNRPL